MDDVPTDAGRRQHPPALPEALQEPPVVTVVRHDIRCQEVKLDHLHTPGSELVLGEAIIVLVDLGQVDKH